MPGPHLPLRGAPKQFGCWQSVAERHLRWSKDQTYTRVFTAVRINLDDQGRDLLCLLSVDSTVVRAHQHAAGA